MNDETSNAVQNFNEILENHGLMNYVNKPTSRAGFIIDLVICEKEATQVQNIVVGNKLWSKQHKFVQFDLNIRKYSVTPKKILIQQKRNFNPQYYIQIAILEMMMTYENIEMNEGYNECNNHNVVGGECVNCLVAVYNKVFGEKYDEMCPQLEKTIKIRENCPWFNMEIKEARKKRRRAELRWRRRRTEERWSEYNIERRIVLKLIKTTKREYYRKSIKDAGMDMNILKKFFNELLGKKWK